MTTTAPRDMVLPRKLRVTDMPDTLREVAASVDPPENGEMGTRTSAAQGVAPYTRQTQPGTDRHPA